ncbi:MAG: DnaA N-terminal domain-containing protein, partial [Acidimicrobiia bacterium]
MTSEAHRLWEMCATLLRAQVSEPVWHTAFEGVRAISFDGRTLTLGVTSPLAKERIEGRYLPLVRDALSEAGAPDVQLELRLEPMEPPTLWT